MNVGDVNTIYLSFPFSTWVLGLCSLLASMNSITSELIVCVFSSLLGCDQFENNDRIWLALYSLQLLRQHIVIAQ